VSVIQGYLTFASASRLLSYWRHSSVPNANGVNGNAGLRTNVLVAIGSAAFVTLFVWFVILCGLPSGGLQLSVV
jgi:hypothetical protein